MCKSSLILAICSALFLSACSAQEPAALATSTPTPSLNLSTEFLDVLPMIETLDAPLSSVSAPRRQILEDRAIGNLMIRVDMMDPTPFPSNTAVLLVKEEGLSNYLTKEKVLSALEYHTIPEGYAISSMNGFLQFGPFDSLEIGISPLPVSDYPYDLSDHTKQVYRMSDWNQEDIWTADAQGNQIAAAAVLAARDIAKSLGLSVGAPSVLYRTPLLDGRTATAIFLPYLLRDIPMQSQHTMHDNWRDQDGREWGYIEAQGLRITILDEEEEVYYLRIAPRTQEVQVLDAAPRLLTWSDALVSVVATVNMNSYSLGASGIALAGARACYVLNAVSGSYDQFEAIPSYELSFLFYDKESSPEIQEFLSSRTFYVDARTGKVFRQ